MGTFEERFAAFGRAIDTIVDRVRSGRSSRPYRSSRSRRTVRDRWIEWRHGAGEKATSAAGAAAGAVADWRRGLDGGGARRLNILMILGAMALTAGATWLWTRTYSAGLSSEEVQALSTLSRGQSNGPVSAPAGGPWWNQATNPK